MSDCSHGHTANGSSVPSSEDAASSPGKASLRLRVPLGPAALTRAAWSSRSSAVSHEQGSRCKVCNCRSRFLSCSGQCGDPPAANGTAVTLSLVATAHLPSLFCMSLMDRPLVPSIAEIFAVSSAERSWSGRAWLMPDDGSATGKGTTKCLNFA